MRNTASPDMRTRLLHPGFFTDHVLCRLSDLTRLVYEGLWLIADREGRLLDNVKMIDGAILPHDTRSCREALDELAAAGRIVRYHTAQGPVIQVLKFLKHQSPHKRETPSALPAEPTEGGSSAGEVGQPKEDPRPGRDAAKVGPRSADPVSVSVSVPKDLAGGGAAPTARRPAAAVNGTHAHTGANQQQPRRVAPTGRAKRAGSAPVDHEKLDRVFGKASR